MMRIKDRLDVLEHSIFDGGPGLVDLVFTDGTTSTVPLTEIFGALDENFQPIDLPLDIRGKNGEISTIHAHNGWRDGNFCAMFAAACWKGCRYVD